MNFMFADQLVHVCGFCRLAAGRWLRRRRLFQPNVLWWRRFRLPAERYVETPSRRIGERQLLWSFLDSDLCRPFVWLCYSLVAQNHRLKFGEMRKR